MKLVVRIVLGAALVVLLAYAGVFGYIYVNQRALQYSPAGPVVALADTALSGAEEVAIASGDGTINGWYQPPQAGRPVILYFKGNAGSFSEEHVRFEQFAAAGYGFLAFDYRGFPLSPGSISQDNILQDGTSAFDWLEQQGFPIVIWGRSLGSGPSTYVASVRDARALLIEAGFHSAVTVANERYPFLPVGLAMQDQYPVSLWIATVTEPVMVAHGTADITIGVSNGERLFALAPNPDEIWIEPGAGHDDLWARGIWARAEAFFSRAMAGP
ncbi:alpha/beta hydrolase [Devosia beringensis]|uniref:alpha/beta hydrolase n=1 Tax=Devosia beringensis TaxID=2657486 RepID=UPI00186B70D2|nr:alpha/beta hydrolase [Devosia beringensis]